MYNTTITVTIVITKDNQKWIHFLRKNLRKVNKEINRKYLGIYLPNADKIQINSFLKLFQLKSMWLNPETNET